MRINHNIPAMNTHRQYSINNTNIAKSVEKLSSGYRVNRAGDDAAGLAISEKMRAQIRGLTMASKNSQDAISMVQTAEGALQTTHDILQRMRELAVQSASDTNEQKIDRQALQQEFQALKDEIDDIASKTRFNDQNLIDGTFQKKVLSLASPMSGVGSFITGISVESAGRSGDFVFAVTAVAPVPAATNGGAVAKISNEATFNVAGTAAQNVIVSTGAAFAGVKTATHNGNAYTVRVDGSSGNALTISLLDTQGNTVSSLQNVDATKWTGTTVALNFGGVGTLSFAVDAASTVTSDANGAGAVKSLLNGKQMLFTATDGEDAVTTDAQQGKLKLTLEGEDIFVEQGDTIANFKESGIVLSFKAVTDIIAGYIQSDGTAKAGTLAGEFVASTIKINSVDGQTFIVQSGANEGDELSINLDAMNTSRLGISFSNITTRTNASAAITEVNTALNRVSTQRADLGALQNRLEFKIQNLDISAENLQAAESRIRDLDMAKEMTNFTRNNILAQAATAMLAQANALPQGVLQLLG